MFKLILVFVLVQLALLARYLIKGEFEPFSYASTYLFLIAAIAIYFLSKRFAKKEQDYTPQNIDSWSFLNRQHLFKIEKPLFKGDEKRGSIQRYYVKKWHYFVADFFGDVYFLALKIRIDNDEYDIKPLEGKWLKNDSYWYIYKNGEQIGTARTVVDMKNIAKLKEVIELHIGDRVYSTAASTVTSKITVFDNNNQVGELKRNDFIRNVFVIHVQDDTPEKLLAPLLHTFYFKNN